MGVSDFQAVIGLEVHAQLLTRSKLFSSASTVFGDPPNAHTTSLCLAMPGALPVLNARAVELAARAGFALGCTVNPVSVWSRKHYFYPDLPKGYQITQYEQPIAEWGQLTLAADKVVRIRRIHMEEDAGKSIHDADPSRSLVDLNRAGTPLIEIVTEPDLRTSDDAVEYLKLLREVLVWLGVNDGNLEEGSFRCDANVSVMRHGATALGTRCELKNLNSFRFIKQAIDYEIARQVDVLESGGAIAQQTRLFDPQAGETRPMRSKEDAMDYRYFPEPDLPPLRLSAAQLEAWRAQQPELPQALRARYVEQLGLPAYDAQVLTQERPWAAFFEACVAAAGDAKKVSNWFLGELARLRNAAPVQVEALKFTPAQLAELIAQVDSAALSNAGAKEVLATLYAQGGTVAEIVAAKGLRQESDGAAIEAAVDAVLAANPSSVEAWKAGKKQVLGFLVGQVMKAMKGKGNPKLVNAALERKLG